MRKARLIIVGRDKRSDRHIYIRGGTAESG